MANFTSNPYFGYSDLLNTFSMSAVDSMSVNNITVTGLATFPNIPINTFVGTDSSNNLVGKGITGRTNQINITTGLNGITLSTPQDINTTSNVVFNSAVLQGATITGLTGSTATFDDLRLTSLTESEFIGVDTSKRFVSRGISGTNNQINITYGSAGITLSTPQDINTNSNVTFNSAVLQGATITGLTGSTITTSLLRSNNIITGGLTATGGIIGTSTLNISGTSTLSTTTVNGQLTMNGLFAQNNNNKGFYIGELPGSAPNYASICHQALASNANNACLVQNSGGDVSFNCPSGKILVFTQGGTHRLRVWNNQPPWGYDGQVEVVSDNDYVSSTNSALRVNGGIYCGKKLFVGSEGTFNGVTTTYLRTSGITATGITANFINTSQLSTFNGGVTTTYLITSGITATGITANSITTSQQSRFNGGITATSLFTSGITATGITANFITTSQQSRFNGGVTTTNLFTSGITATGITANFITTSQQSRFNGGITATSLFTSGITFIGATGLTLSIASVNVSGATALRYAYFNANRDLVAVNDPSTNLLSSNNIWTGGNTFTQTLNISSSKDKFNLTRIPLLTDGGKIYRSEYTESDFVLTSTAQNIAGNKVFLNNPTVINTTENSTVAIVAGSSSFNRAQIYFQSFIGSDQSLVMFCDSSTFNFFNFNTGRTIWDIPKSTDRPNFPQSISLSGQSASRILLTDSSRNVISGSFGESEIVRTTTNQSIAGNKTFTGQIITNKYVTASNRLNPLFSLTVGNEATIQFANVVNNGINVVNNAEFTTTMAGMYAISWTIRLNTASVWEVATWIRSSDDTSVKYGLQPFPVSSPYVSSSVILSCSASATIEVRLFNGRSDSASISLANTEDTRLSIKYIGTN
jgi:hypothetical protein